MRIGNKMTSRQYIERYKRMIQRIQDRNKENLKLGDKIRDHYQEKKKGGGHEI